MTGSGTARENAQVWELTRSIVPGRGGPGLQSRAPSRARKHPRSVGSRDTDARNAGNTYDNVRSPEQAAKRLGNYSRRCPWVQVLHEVKSLATSVRIYGRRSGGRARLHRGFCRGASQRGSSSCQPINRTRRERPAPNQSRIVLRRPCVVAKLPISRSSQSAHRRVDLMLA